MVRQLPKQQATVHKLFQSYLLILIGLRHRRRSPARGFNPDTRRAARRERKARFNDGTRRLAHECGE